MGRALSRSFDDTVEFLKALAEPTRLRLGLLLLHGDLTVSDFVTILGQSQPRISRHLKLMAEAGVVSRVQEGTWAYFRLNASASAFLRTLLPMLDVATGAPCEDLEKLDVVRAGRAERAAAYFSRNAARWDEIRSLHVPDADVEAVLSEIVGEGRPRRFLDVGTGTGRMLELLGPRADWALGVDASREMLAIARAKLDCAELTHVSVRLGDAYRLPVDRASCDLICLHHILHFLDDPAAAIAEAAAALAPGGRIIVVDFDAHDREFLRTDHAHVRLGFSAESLTRYFTAAGLAFETVRALRPARDDQLTVLVTAARKPGVPVQDTPGRTVQFA